MQALMQATSWSRQGLCWRRSATRPASWWMIFKIYGGEIMITIAKLIKLKTDDGLMEMNDDIPLGKNYVVDTDTKRIVRGFNLEYGKEWEREIIFTPSDGFLPTELLEIPE